MGRVDDGAPATRAARPLTRLFGDDRTFRDAWGRHPLVQRGRSGAFDDVLTLDAVDAFVASSPRRPTVRMVIDGDVLPASQYCSRIRLGGQHLDDVVDVRKVVDRMCDGATLVLQSLHRCLPAVGAFVDALQCETSHPVQANAYLTPPGARGLADHADDHDVVAVQLHGQKRWSVEGLGDVVLRPGDTLYVPAQTTHRASASDDTSLHLTLGIIRVTARDVVQRLLRTPADELDLPLPVGYQEPENAGAVARQIDAALRAVTDRLAEVDVAEVVEFEQHRQRRRPESVGHITSMAHRHRLTLDGVIRWTAPEPLARSLERHERNGGHWDGYRDTEQWPPVRSAAEVDVHLGDRTITFPAAATEALRRLSHGAPTRVGDLPGIDEPSRLVLARRLVEESACVIETLGSAAQARADRPPRRRAFRVRGARVSATRGRAAGPPGLRRHRDHRPDEETDMSGESDQAKGRVKQAAGDLTDDEELKREGQADESAGKLKDAVDDAKDKVNEAIDSIKEKTRGDST